LAECDEEMQAEFRETPFEDKPMKTKPLSEKQHSSGSIDNKTNTAGENGESQRVVQHSIKFYNTRNLSANITGI